MGLMRLGLFPAKVQADGVVYEQVRVYATDDFIELWMLVGGRAQIVASGSGLVKQARGVGAFMADGTRAKWSLELSDGTAWLVSPGAGCGCSHPLKRFDPSKAER